MTGINQHALNIDLPADLPVIPSFRSLERRLNSWKFQNNHPLDMNDPQLMQRLWVLFYEMGLNDKEMIAFLILEGYTIGLCTFVIKFII